MNINFPSPAVCVIDDEPEEYEAILKALLRLGICAVHVNGNSKENLPPDPIKGLRLVFLDLHLNNASSDKDKRSHTAKVFSRVVSTESPLVVVIIWSKYPDEAAKFMETLFIHEPKFKERLIYISMAKLTPDDPSDDWSDKIMGEIESKLQDLDAFKVLWGWETLVKDAGSEVGNELCRVLAPNSNNLSDSTQAMDDGTILAKRNKDLKQLFQTLAREQGAPDCNENTVSRHLVTVLAQLLTDHLEHANSEEIFKEHATWLCEDQVTKVDTDIASQINGVLLTAASTGSGMSFIPGTVYRINKEGYLNKYFDCENDEVLINSLSKQCFKGKSNSRHEIVFVEISPACDVQQDKRKNVFLIGGILHARETTKNNETTGSNFHLLPFSLRWDGNVLKDGDSVILSVCSLYKLTLNSNHNSDWLIPWFRLRELPTASLRNLYASHSSRVGYVSLNSK